MKISFTEAKKISNYLSLSQCFNLKQLDLSNNIIDDGGVFELTESINEIGRNLEIIDFNNNKIKFFGIWNLTRILGNIKN